MSDRYDLGRITKIKNGMKEALNISVNDDSKNIKEKEFYGDIDKKKRNKGCSLAAVIIFLIIIFGFLVYSLIFIKNYTKTGITYVARNNSQNQTDLKESFISQTSSIEPGESLKLEYNEVEVANYLGIADSDFPLKKSRLNIDENGIEVSGKTSDSIISLPVRLVVRPKIDSGKFTLVLDDLQSASVSLPKIIRDNVNDYMVRLMKTRELYDQNLEVISAYTQEEKLVIEVSRKV